MYNIVEPPFLIGAFCSCGSFKAFQSCKIARGVRFVTHSMQNLRILMKLEISSDYRRAWCYSSLPKRASPTATEYWLDGKTSSRGGPASTRGFTCELFESLTCLHGLRNREHHMSRFDCDMGIAFILEPAPANICHSCRQIPFAWVCRSNNSSDVRVRSQESCSLMCSTLLLRNLSRQCACRERP